MKWKNIFTLKNYNDDCLLLKIQLFRNSGIFSLESEIFLFYKFIFVSLKRNQVRISLEQNKQFIIETFSRQVTFNKEVILGQLMSMI